jgi:hypothetical protein
MSETRLFIEIDGTELTQDELGTLGQVGVEEALEQADAATLVARLEPRGDGEWASVLDALAEPRTSLVVQVSNGEASYRFDGLSAEASWHIDAEGDSQVTVKAVDRSLELDLEERIATWPGNSESSIAEAIFGQHGLLADVEETPAGPDPDVHIVLQRGTDLAFLRSLAAKWGYDVYLEAGEIGVTGHFHTTDPLADPQGVIPLGFAGGPGAVDVTARLVDGRRVKATRVPTLSDTPQQGEADGADQALGARTLAGVSTLLLSPDDLDGEIDPSVAALALAREAAFAVRLTAVIDTAAVGLLVRARRPLLVTGLGSSLSGRYMVESVRHEVSPERHRQHLSLVRNALGVTGDEPFGSLGLGGLP